MSFKYSFSGVQEENKKLEVLAFEYETDIASLEEELAASYREKEEVISINEGMASEIETLSEQLNISNKELNVLQEEISALVSSAFVSLYLPGFVTLCCHVDYEITKMLFFFSSLSVSLSLKPQIWNLILLILESLFGRI